jgi:hypothetical protein
MQNEDADHGLLMPLPIAARFQLALSGQPQR